MKKRALLETLSLPLLSFLLLLPLLGYGFLSDDFPLIVANPRLQSWSLFFQNLLKKRLDLSELGLIDDEVLVWIWINQTSQNRGLFEKVVETDEAGLQPLIATGKFDPFFFAGADRETGTRDVQSW